MLLGWHLSLKKIKARVQYWVTLIAKIEGRLEEVLNKQNWRMCCHWTCTMILKASLPFIKSMKIDGTLDTQKEYCIDKCMNTFKMYFLDICCLMNSILLSLSLFLSLALSLSFSMPTIRSDDQSQTF